MANKFNYGKVVLITGASSGIGGEAAYALAKEGYRVYGASRRGTLPKPHEGIIPIKMDVTDEKSVKLCIDEIINAQSTLDILIHAAGDGIAGPVEFSNTDDAITQMDVNYFGAIRLLNQVLPIFRKKRSGLVVFVGSVGGIFPIPYQSLYSSSKAALMMLCGALRLEMQPFNVKATLIAPGDVKTGFTAARRYVKQQWDSDYQGHLKRAVSRMENDEINGMSPGVVVKAILKALKAKKLRQVYVAGGMYRLFVFAKRLLPDALTEKLLYSMYLGGKLK